MCWERKVEDSLKYIGISGQNKPIENVNGLRWHKLKPISVTMLKETLIIFFNKFIYLVCVGSLLLHTGFL